MKVHPVRPSFQRGSPFRVAAHARHGRQRSVPDNFAAVRGWMAVASSPVADWPGPRSLDARHRQAVRTSPRLRSTKTCRRLHNFHIVRRHAEPVQEWVWLHSDALTGTESILVWSALRRGADLQRWFPKYQLRV